MALTFVYFAPCALGQTPSAQGNEEDWFVLLLEGRKVGHQQSQRWLEGTDIVLRDTMELVIQRGSASVTQKVDATTRESQSGTPISFTQTMTAGSATLHTEGRWTKPGELTITETGTGLTRKRTLRVPTDTKFPEALQRALVNAKLKIGQSIEFNAFEPSIAQAYVQRITLLGVSKADLPIGVKELFEVQQVSKLEGGDISALASVDREFTPYRVRTPVGSVNLEQIRSTKAEALSPNQDSAFFDAVMLESPRELVASERTGTLRFTIDYDGDDEVSFPQTSEQKVERVENEFTLTICEQCATDLPSERTPGALERAKLPNSWLQSDDKILAGKAKALTRGMRTAGQKMQALEDFVRMHIVDKDLSVGYDSALDTLNNKRGDCTEHALLLAAMGRALSIATRVATGFAYANSYVGKQQIFVPHAWTQAFVDGRWQSYDAALEGFDASHILTSFGDGNPYRFFGAQRLLGALEITQIKSVSTGAIP